MVPQSGCNARVGFMFAMYVAFMGWIAVPQTSWFHGFSIGKMRQPETAPPPDGTPPEVPPPEVPAEPVAPAPAVPVVLVVPAVPGVPVVPPVPEPPLVPAVPGLMPVSDDEHPAPSCKTPTDKAKATCEANLMQPPI